MSVNVKLAELRKAMKEKRIDAYIIPSSDPHQSEYVANHWKTREWISGFTGSAGTVIVSMDHAGLWADSRYFLQAEQQLSTSEFKLHKVFNQYSPTHVSWLLENLPEGATVGVDGWVFSKAQVAALKRKLKLKNIHLNESVDLISVIWKSRPGLPDNPIFEHEIQYTGKSRVEKLVEIRNEMEKQSVDYHFVSTLDDIAWILNLRGNDVECNPVAIAYCLIGKEHAHLFIDPIKVHVETLFNLNRDGIEIHHYSHIRSHLNSLNEKETILIDAHGCNNTLFRAINCQDIVEGNTISRLMKARKNETETGHFRKVMVKDGIALLRLFMWLEKQLNNGVGVTEAQLADQLADFRSQQALYFGESFAAIVGYKANGAIIHYRPEHGSAATIKREGILLLDSGGQYRDGTTDITRTIALGKPTAEQKRNYTHVLKGHIALDRVIYPIGTNGCQLDVLARMSLWSDGINYLHGTGHGVGFFLNVHEPPQGFTAGPSPRSNTILEPGMVTSNEPGYYKEDEYGIRIENLILTKESDKEGFLEHETLTLFPIDQKLIDLSMLDEQEIEWLNSYHKKVFEKLSPGLNTEEIEWLKSKCAMI